MTDKEVWDGLMEKTNNDGSDFIKETNKEGNVRLKYKSWHCIKNLDGEKKSVLDPIVFTGDYRRALEFINIFNPQKLSYYVNMESIV